MLSRSAKQAFYKLAGPLMRVNAFVYKNFRFQDKPEKLIKIHLGPGQKKYMPGWINIDANMFTGRCDVWADLRFPLPFPDSSCDAFYSHHMIEHLPDLQKHFKDVFRCMKAGGVYRVGGPDGDGAIKKFTEGDKSWFGSWPDNRRSIGGRFDNFIFCRGEHLTILSYSFLEEMLVDAGFRNIKKCVPTLETFRTELFDECLNMEEESDFETPHTLIVEAEKPQNSN
jgi:predicted SAM-dependent methyltransferase